MGHDRPNACNMPPSYYRMIANNLSAPTTQSRTSQLSFVFDDKLDGAVIPTQFDKRRYQKADRRTGWRPTMRILGSASASSMVPICKSFLCHHCSLRPVTRTLASGGIYISSRNLSRTTNLNTILNSGFRRSSTHYL